MRRIAIIGSLDLAQLIAHHFRQDGHGVIAGFFDDFRAPGDDTAGGKVLGPISEAVSRYEAGEFDCFMMGIGYKHFRFRRATFETLGEKIPAYSLVHSSSYVDAGSSVGSGALILPGCVVDQGCAIGANCVLNTACVIAHDSSVGAHSFLGPGVNVAGFVAIGMECFLGIGSTIIDNVKLAQGVQTGAGAVVVEDLQDPGLYLGIPAKRKRED